MKKILGLIFIIKILFPLLGFSQKQHPLIPQSPTAAAAGKYGDIDVSLYTGQINPSIKLFDIKFNDFDFPISLNYASSGLKVHEIPASTGMGTSLSCLYVVNRQVRSVPDEQIHGYNGLQPTASVVQSIINYNYTPTTAYSTVTEADFKIKIGQTDYDGEPDLFNVSGPTFSGKFFFDETQNASNQKNAIFIPRQATAMVANFNYSTSSLFNAANNAGGIDKFTFYDIKGVKYTFDKKEGALLDDDDFQYGKNIVNTWYLGEIETPNGNKLTFKYIQRTIDLPHAQSEYRNLFFETITTGGGVGSDLDYAAHKVVSKTTINETVLSEILINDGNWGKVEFIENTANRADWSFSQSGTKPKSLKEILLKDGSGGIIKKYAFTYDDNIANRLLLRNITEYGKGGTTAQEPYKFDYYGETEIPTLPFEGSGVISREDHWGYYNANLTGTLLPDYEIITTSLTGKKDTLTVAEFTSLPDSLKNFQKGLGVEKLNNLASGIASSIPFVTATNRSPDFNSALIGQLKKITYPSKASTEFIYEANSYYSNQDDEFNPCSGDYQSIVNVLDNSAITQTAIEAKFTVPEGGYSCFKAVYSIKLNSFQQDIINGNVLIKNDDNGVIVFEKNLQGNNNASDITLAGSDYVVLQPGNYTAKADVFGENATSANISVVSIDVQAIPVTANNYLTRTSGGVRIKESRDCPSNIDSLCLIKEFDYSSFSDSKNSSGSIVTKGRYYYPIKYFAGEANRFLNALYLNSTSQLPLSTTLGHYVGYNNVTVKEVKILATGVRVYKGKTVFDYRCPNDLPDLVSSTFPFTTVSLDWQRGIIENYKITDKEGTWLKDVSNAYTNYPNDYFKFVGLKAGKFIFNTESSTVGTFADLYSFNKYVNVTNFQYNQQIIDKEQFKVNNVLSNIENTTTYTYDNALHLQPTSIQTTSSKGETLLTQYTYPNDITNATDSLYASATALLANFRKGEILRTETFRAGSSVSKTENKFAYFGSNLLPSNQKSFIAGSTLTANESKQLSYDTYGNLTSFKENNGLAQSIMWAYNGQYPAVYMVNGTPTDANSLLSISDNTTLKTTADSYRSTMDSSHISNYMYDPFIGLISQINPAQIATSYTYDGLNRLNKILDTDGNIINAYDYQVAANVGDNNYVKEIIQRTPSTSVLTGLNDVKTSINYFDGLGRPLQTVALKAGNAGLNDIISNLSIYDSFGRVVKNYIPFPKAGNGALASMPAAFNGDTRPFTENLLFDESPLNRLLAIRGVGKNWEAKQTKTFTEATGGQKSFSVAADGTVTTGTYPANSLYKKTIIDEDGNSAAEYIDKEGRVVLKEQVLNSTETAYTAYIYNNLGQLAYIIQPNGYSTTGFSITDEVYTNSVFAYKYDYKGRNIEKKVPGADLESMVYDIWDRLIFSQDAEQKETNTWMYYKYDALNRLIITGTKVIALSRAELQDAENRYPAKRYEKPINVAPYYTLTESDPQVTIADIKQINYYDNYNWISSDLAFSEANKYHDKQNSNLGFATGSISRKTDTADNSFLANAIYYDYKGRKIQSFSQNYFGRTDRADFEYNFANELTQVRSQNNYLKATANESTRTLTKNALDHVGRLKKVEFGSNINASATARISAPLADPALDTYATYSYDSIGRTITKTILPGNYSIACSVAALPIDLLDFKGVAYGDTVNLTWKVANEKEFSHFELQRSNNGTEFNSIKTIKGTKNEIYTYRDLPPHPDNVVYYKLNMVDVDGKSTQSKTIAFSFDGILPYLTIENPVHEGSFWIATNLEQPSFKLASASGQNIPFEQTVLNKGQYRIKVQNAPLGLYYFTAMAGDNVITKKLILK